MAMYDPPGLDDPPGGSVKDWLTPIGDTGFYISPMEPVDPFDCEAYPDSPYCADAIDPNIALSLNPLRWLPDFYGIDLGDIAEGTPFGFDPNVSITRCETCFNTSATVMYLPTPTFSVCWRNTNCRNPPDPQPPNEPPGSSGFIPWIDRFPGCEKIAKFRVPFHKNTFTNTEIGGYQPAIYSYDAELINTEQTSNVILGEIAGLAWTVEYTEYGGWYGMIHRNFYYNFYVIRPNGNRETVFSASPSYFIFYSEEKQAWDSIPSPLPRFLGIELVPGQPPPCSSIRFPPPHPIPPPPLPTRDPMSCNCCQDTEDLLRLIARRLGTGSYPVKVPEYLVTSQGNRTVEIQSLTQFLTWLTYQVDALAGEFPVEIEITDIDPATEGDQKKKIKLHNIAESFAEMYALTVKNTVNSDVHTNFLLRMVSELIATKNATLITQDYVKANTDFLGYEGNPKRRKIPYAFDVEGRESLDKLLKNCDKEIEGWESKSKDTVLEYFQRLMFAAGIIKAVYYRTPRDMSRVLKEIENIMNPDSDDVVRDDANWDAFLNAINDPNNRFNRDAPKPKVTDPRKGEREARRQRNQQQNQQNNNSGSGQNGQTNPNGQFNNLDGGGR